MFASLAHETAILLMEFQSVTHLIDHQAVIASSAHQSAVHLMEFQSAIQLMEFQSVRR
jgi:hypothetical protein